MVALFAALIPIGSQQELSARLDQQISYETVAKPAAKIVTELGAKCRLQIDSSHPASLDVFAISVRDLTVRELLQKMAVAAHAEIKYDEFGIHFIRSRESIVKDRADEEELTKQWILKSFDQIKERLSRKQTMDSDGVKQYLQSQRDQAESTGSSDIKFIYENSPINRLRDQLVLCTEPEVLAKLRPNERIVYSTKPNQLQRLFRGDWNMAVSRFGVLWQTWAAATKETVNNQAQYDQEAGLRSGLTPDKALLICTRARGSIMCDLKVVASNGAVLSDLTIGSTISVDPRANAWSLTKTDPSNPGSPVAFSPLALALSDNQRACNIRLESRKEAPDVPEAVNQWAQQPETFDPLSLHPSELAIHLAKKTHKNLVALLPDSSVYISYRADQTDVKMQSELERAASMKFKEDGDWLIGAPIRPYFAQVHRLDRSHLGPLFRHANQTPALPIDELSGFVYKYRDVRLIDTEFIAFGFPIRNKSTLTAICQNQDILSLYGSLTQGQRRALVEGKRLEYATLNSEQKQFYSALIFNQQNLAVYSPSDLPQISGLESVYSEPTEAVPNGIPGTAILELAVNHSDAVLSSDSRHESIPIDIIAQGLYNSENSESPIRVSSEINIGTRFMLGKQSKYRFRLRANDLLHKDSELSFVDFDPNQRPILIKDHPKPVYDAIMKRLEEIRKSLNDITKQDNQKRT